MKKNHKAKVKSRMHEPIKTKAMLVSEINEGMIPARRVSKKVVMRLVKQIQNRKLYPTIVVDENTGWIVGSVASLRALRKLKVKTINTVQLNLSMGEAASISDACEECV